jgi:hypothetical protein
MTTERTSSDAVIQEPQQQESDLLTDNTTEEQLQTEVEQGLSEGAKENVESGEPEVSNQGAETTEVTNQDLTQQDADRNYSHQEVSKIQSSYDKRAADHEKTINDLQQQVDQMKQNQEAQTMQYSEQQIRAAQDAFVRDKAQWLVANQGLDEQQAYQQASQEGVQAAQSAMMQIQLDKERQAIEQQKQAINDQARITATNQIANKYGVNAADLVGFDTPQQMERYAAALSQKNQVVQDNTPKFNTSGDVPPDNIPSNDNDIIDRYGSGDPKITVDMYEGAMKRQNPNWHG